MALPGISFENRIAHGDAAFKTRDILSNNGTGSSRIIAARWTG